MVINLCLWYMFYNTDKKKCIQKCIPKKCIPLSKWHSKYSYRVPDIISAMGKNCVLFCLFYIYKANTLAIMQIKILAAVLTSLQLVVHNPPAQSTGTDASTDTPWKELVTDWSGRFGPGRTKLKISTRKWHFECQSASSSSTNCSCIFSLGKMKK